MTTPTPTTRQNAQREDVELPTAFSSGHGFVTDSHSAPDRRDVLADITRYLMGSSGDGGDRAYFVKQTRLGMGLVVVATDIDSMERSEWEVELRPRIVRGEGNPK